MLFNQISFQSFTGRSDALQSIKRFAICNPMFYRTDLLMHSQRVSWIVETLLPFANNVFSNFDGEKARTLALVHDDAEIITGDIQLYYKLKMTPEQLRQYEQNEDKAIDELSMRYPKTVNNYNYQSLLLHALHKDCIEAQLVSLADKLDAFGESLHEIYAGNNQFKHSTLTYIKLLSEFGSKFPQLKPLFTIKYPALQNPLSLNVLAIIKQGQPHTLQTIQQNTGVPHYEYWKQITINHHAVPWLLDKKE
ncbi:HD domain-containing protein [Candidatus Woesearchaeota archaeon]|nr:HD domain-containing protein [Candidatus Woesearchaeota archaeon]